ncbi:MAG: hypothetical protein MUE52_07530 [Tabrizicola sp.]|jgi:hypothetical protein|nr:hypothetical protein [Tabrizicola sp.]
MADSSTQTYTATPNADVAKGIADLAQMAADNRLFTTQLMATQIQMNIDNKLAKTSDKVGQG